MYLQKHPKIVLKRDSEDATMNEPEPEVTSPSQPAALI